MPTETLTPFWEREAFWEAVYHTTVGGGALDNFPRFEDEQISALQAAGIVTGQQWSIPALRAICAGSRLDPYGTEAARQLANEIVKGFTILSTAQILNHVITGAESVIEDATELQESPSTDPAPSAHDT